MPGPSFYHAPTLEKALRSQIAGTQLLPCSHLGEQVKVTNSRDPASTMLPPYYIKVTILRSLKWLLPCHTPDRESTCETSSSPSPSSHMQSAACQRLSGPFWSLPLSPQKWASSCQAWPWRRRAPGTSSPGLGPPQPRRRTKGPPLLRPPLLLFGLGISAISDLNLFSKVVAW